MRELFLIITYIHTAVRISSAITSRKNLHVGEKPPHSKVSDFVASVVVLFVTILMLPIALIKIATKNITNEDAEESTKNLSEKLLIREGLSFIEWRDHKQVLEQLAKKDKLPEKLVNGGEENKEFFVILSLLMGCRFGFYEMRLETKEEFMGYHSKKIEAIASRISNIAEEETSGISKEHSGLLKKLMDELGGTIEPVFICRFEDLQKFDEMEQLRYGRRLMFKAKNIGNKKEPPMWLISWLMPQV